MITYTKTLRKRTRTHTHRHKPNTKLLTLKNADASPVYYHKLRMSVPMLAGGFTHVELVWPNRAPNKEGTTGKSSSCCSFHRFD